MENLEEMRDLATSRRQSKRQ